MTSTHVPEHLAHMVRLMAERGKSIKDMQIVTRLSEPTIAALLRGENPDTSLPDEEPLFPNPDQQPASS